MSVFCETMRNVEPQTPMVKQYLEIKKSLPKKTLLFFRLGDFYEMFNEDAEVGARLLNLTLTHRGTMPMVGVPYHAASSYINKILQHGFKVAICDQTSTPKPGQLVKRTLSRILTPGTVLNEQQLHDKNNQYILAITANKNEISMAWIEASTGEFQIATSKKPSELLPVAHALNPCEIIVPENYYSEWKALDTNVRESIEVLLKNRTISELPDFYFDKVHGANIAMGILGVLNFDGFGITPEYYPALGPAGALLHYIKENFRQNPQNIESIKLYNPLEFMQIDSASMKNLEIFYSSSGQRVGSLINAIDNTVTAAGARELENFIIEPCLNKNEILRRQNCVRTFVENEAFRLKTQIFLKGTYDLARVLTRLQNKLKNPRDLNAVRLTIKQLPDLKKLLQKSESVEIRQLADSIHTFDSLQNLLDAALMTENLPTDLVDGGYIRQNYDAKLDEYRELSTNCKGWINTFERREQAQTGIRSLKVRHNNNFGYFIEVTKSNLSLVPTHYIRRQTTVNSERYTTPELKQKESEITNAQALSIELEEKIFIELVGETLKNFPELVTTAKTLAQLDVFCGWGELAQKWHYSCPIITTENCLIIEQGRHPVIEQILKSENSFSNVDITDFVPNDINLEANKTQIALLTGPNMAGKSTYIRQVALIVLLAHIGCWVPAKKCKMSIIDKIFSRVGAGDDLSRGRSTFMMEMSETANILNNMTPASLVILDEIGRGTSTYDGLSIAWAVVEYLHENNCPKTLFATHYHELTRLESSLPYVKNFQVEVKEWQNSIIFLRKVIPGASDKSYGVHVAKLAGMPHSVIARANDILKELEDEGTNFTKNVWHKKQKSEIDKNQLTLL